MENLSKVELMKLVAELTASKKELEARLDSAKSMLLPLVEETEKADGATFIVSLTKKWQYSEKLEVMKARLESQKELIKCEEKKEQIQGIAQMVGCSRVLSVRV